MHASLSTLLGETNEGQLNGSGSRWHVWGIGDINAGFGAEIWGGGDNLEDLGVGWRIMLTQVLERDD
jgi:hypothetical protein